MIFNPVVQSSGGGSKVEFYYGESTDDAIVDFEGDILSKFLNKNWILFAGVSPGHYMNVEAEEVSAITGFTSVVRLKNEDELYVNHVSANDGAGGYIAMKKVTDFGAGVICEATNESFGTNGTYFEVVIHDAGGGTMNTLLYSAFELYPSFIGYSPYSVMFF